MNFGLLADAQRSGGLPNIPAEAVCQDPTTVQAFAAWLAEAIRHP